MKHIRTGVAVAAAALFFVCAPTALAEHPMFLSYPTFDILVGTDHVRTPPGVPKVGDTLWGNNGSPSCSPPCDPNAPNAYPNNPYAVILPGNGEPPIGQFFSFNRCNDSGCIQVQGKSSTQNTYVVQPEDAGSKIQLVVWLTNLDCGEIRRDGTNYQECRYTTTQGLVQSETVLPNVTVAVGPETLPNPSIGDIYYVTLAASNGTGPYAFSLKSGTLPPGLSITASGVVNGTPTATGTYTFTVQATGSGVSPGTRTYTLTVGLGMPGLTNGTTGIPYSQPLAAKGATGAVTYAVTAGTLPPGLAVSGTQIAGTPTKQGLFAFTLKATDAAGATGSRQYALKVDWPTLTLAPATIEHAVRGVPYTATFSASGGSAPYSFTLTDGALPLGLSLKRDGRISGTPREQFPGTYELTIEAHDQYGAPVTAMYTLEYLAPTITVSPKRLTAVAGEKTRIRLKAGGGTGPYEFEQRTGRLPEGMRLGRRGVLAGRPSTPGVFTFGIRVTDSDGAFAILRLRLVVKQGA